MLRGDRLKCQISPLVKYRQNKTKQYYYVLLHTLYYEAVCSSSAHVSKVTLEKMIV